MKRAASMLLCWAALAHLAGRPVPADDKKPPERVDVQKEVYPFLRKYCVSCHNDVTGTAKPSLTHLQTAEAIRKDADTWRLVLKTVATGTMPPAGRLKPAKRDADGFERSGGKLLEGSGR